MLHHCKEVILFSFSRITYSSQIPWSQLHKHLSNSEQIILDQLVYSRSYYVRILPLKESLFRLSRVWFWMYYSCTKYARDLDVMCSAPINVSADFMWFNYQDNDLLKLVDCILQGNRFLPSFMLVVDVVCGAVVFLSHYFSRKNSILRQADFLYKCWRPLSVFQYVRFVLHNSNS